MYYDENELNNSSDAGNGPNEYNNSSNEYNNSNEYCNHIFQAAKAHPPSGDHRHCHLHL